MLLSRNHPVESSTEDVRIGIEFFKETFDRGYLCTANTPFNEAKIHFQKATDVDQNFVEAYFNLARILNSPAEHDQAVRNYETALEIDPKMSICHYWFAKLLTSGQKLANDGTLLSEPNPEKAKFHF